MYRKTYPPINFLTPLLIPHGQHTLEVWFWGNPFGIYSASSVSVWGWGISRGWKTTAIDSRKRRACQNWLFGAEGVGGGGLSLLPKKKETGVCNSAWLRSGWTHALYFPDPAKQNALPSKFEFTEFETEKNGGGKLVGAKRTAFKFNTKLLYFPRVIGCQRRCGNFVFPRELFLFALFGKI